MKKILTLITACALTLLVFAACTNDAEESSAPEAESSAFEQSDVASKPWYDNVVSTGELSLPQNDNSTGQPTPDEESTPEQSIPEASLPDEEQSTPDTDSNEIESALNGIGLKSASGCRIAFTKESALVAEACFTNTNIGVTAIFDGAVTRFFGAVNGEYYIALYGEYLAPCHDGFYDISSGKRGDFVEFKFDENGKFISADENNHIHTDTPNEIVFYSPFNKKAYCYDVYSDHSRLFVYEDGEGAAICRELMLNCDIEADWKNNSLAIDESSLGKYGLVEDGEIIIPFEYDSISTYLGQSDLATGNSVGVVRAEKDGRFYYISTSGYLLTPEGFDCGSQPFADRAWVFNGGQGYIIEFN